MFSAESRLQNRGEDGKGGGAGTNMFDQVLTVHFELNVFHRSRSTIFCPTSAGSSLPFDGK